VLLSLVLLALLEELLLVQVLAIVLVLPILEDLPFRLIPTVYFDPCLLQSSRLVRCQVVFGFQLQHQY